MKRYFFACCLAFCLFFGLSTPAAAGETRKPKVIVNAVTVILKVPVHVEYGTTYVPVWGVTRALYPDATLSLTGGDWVITAPGLTLKFRAGRKYLISNGRYLYLPYGLRYAADGTILAPSRILGSALGSSVDWDPVHYGVVFTSGKKPAPSSWDVYNSDDVYWLSRIIYAESGNQSLEGKIAVGNVVLNRVARKDFPNTVQGVIFQKNQFSPVASGGIYCTPNDESVIAAKMCLEGANTIGNALYFFNPNIIRNCWAARNRNYLATIGEHVFYA